MVFLKQGKLLHPHDLESLSLTTGHMFGPSSLSGLLRPLLTSGNPSGFLTKSLVPWTGLQTSPGKNNHLPPTSAAFTPLPLDGYGLCLVT
jgi:hypothetical protein